MLTAPVFAQIIPLALIMTATVIPVTKSLPTVTMFAKMSTNVQPLMSRFSAWANNNGSYECCCDLGYEFNYAGDMLASMNAKSLPMNAVMPMLNVPITQIVSTALAKTVSGPESDVQISTNAAGHDNCAELATCTNTAGSFECTCPEGYNTADDGVTCQDVDE